MCRDINEGYITIEENVPGEGYEVDVLYRNIRGRIRQGRGIYAGNGKWYIKGYTRRSESIIGWKEREDSIMEDCTPYVVDTSRLISKEELLNSLFPNGYKEESLFEEDGEPKVFSVDYITEKFLSVNGYDVFTKGKTDLVISADLLAKLLIKDRNDLFKRGEGNINLVISQSSVLNKILSQSVVRCEDTWISMEDALPPHNVMVEVLLVKNGNGYSSTSFYDTNIPRWSRFHGLITHWRSIIGGSKKCK